jgi:hypothetical protein
MYLSSQTDCKPFYTPDTYCIVGTGKPSYSHHTLVYRVFNNFYSHFPFKGCTYSTKQVVKLEISKLNLRFTKTVY